MSDKNEKKNSWIFWYEKIFLDQISKIWGGGGGPDLGLWDLAALRSKTFAIPSYPF